MSRTQLSPARRAADRARLTGEVVDVLVVGGGPTGAWVALDAAARGLAVALLEAGGWSAGPSTTLLGGSGPAASPLRLAGLLRERARLLRTAAPHLVRPVPLLLPLPVPGRPLGGTALPGVPGPGLPAPRLLSRRAALAAVPGLRADAVTGAVRCWDAQVDRARLTLAVVRTAAGYGARLLAHARVTALLRDGERDRAAVTGVRVTDRTDGSAFPVRARSVVVATGADGGGPFPVAVPGLRTPHLELVLRRSALGGGDGLLLPTPDGVLSVVPDDGRWTVHAPGTDVRPVLDELSRALTPRVAGEDVVEVRVGRASREPAVVSPVPGLVRATGGGLAVSRVTAAAAVDAATAGLPGVPPSRTAHLPLVGAHRWADVRGGTPGTATGLPDDVVDRLLHRYGDRVADVLDLVRADPELGRPLPGAPAHLAAEVVHAVAAEGALDGDDVLTRLGPVGPEARPAVVASIVGEVGRTAREAAARAARRGTPPAV